MNPQAGPPGSPGQGNSPDKSPGQPNAAKQPGAGAQPGSGQPLPGQARSPGPGVPGQGLPGQIPPGKPGPHLPDAAGQPADPAPGPVTPDRSAQIAQYGQQWSNPQAESQEENARNREEQLSGNATSGVRDVYQGDVHQGNVYFMSYQGRGGAKFKAHRLPAERIEEPFVPPSGFEAVRAAVGDSRIVVVRGRRGTGRCAALVHALTGGEGRHAVMKLAEETDLGTFSPTALRTCVAIVLDDLARAHLDQLTDDTVERLDGELAQAGRWLGLTMSIDDTVPPALQGRVVDIGEPPKARAVFEAHLQEGVLGREDQLRVVADIGPPLDEVDDDSTVGLRQVARLANELAASAALPDDLMAVVKRYLDPEYECVQWFRGLPDARASAMAMSLAVFGGLAREQVTAAATRLAELVDVRRRRVGNPFGSDADVPLTVLRAVSESTVVAKMEGDVPITAIRFSTGKYPHWVLDFVWKELDVVRPHVITWLRGLGEHEDMDVRTSAAVAVGVLARNAFDYLYAEIIGGWAESSNPSLRECAAWALGPPSRDPHLRETVDGLVRSWLADGDRPLLQATAARTFGGEAGRARFLRSMRMLATAAEVDDLDVQIAVAMSLGDIVKRGTAAMAGRVLNDVVTWIAGRDRQLQRVGRLVVVRLGYLRGRPTLLEMPDGPQERALRTIPTMLILASRDPRIGERVVWLWAQSLDSTDYRPVRAALAEWATAVEHHPDARLVLTEVLRRLAADHLRAGAVIRREPSLAAYL